MANPQNTNDAGDDPALTPATVGDLAVTTVIRTLGQVNATPVVSDGLLFIGDGGPSGASFYVIDLRNGGARLIQLKTGATVSTPLIGNGVQSTALVATVSTPAGEQRRVYFGANVKPKSFWCLNVDKILADRATLASDPGTGYLCDGADWPIIIAGAGDLSNGLVESSPLPVYDASPTFVKHQWIVDGSGRYAYHDVIFTPTIGADCSDGQLWAVDAYSAEVLWIYDPVPNFQRVVGNPAAAGPGYGGMIWTVPAVSKDGKHLYVTTGDCVEQPQLGFQAESLVDIDPERGVVQWYQQRRLTDTSDYDIGNSPVVVDVDGPAGCHNVITSDKDGCIYGFSQQGDVPQVGAPGWDPARPGQARPLFRTCLVVGSLNGGFNASGVSFHGRTVMAQASSTGGRAPGDTANAFAIDACTGDYVWSTASVSPGIGEGAIASGMWFQPSGTTVQVLRAGPSVDIPPASHRPDVLATIALPAGVSTTAGGGGPSIVDGTVYIPVKTGVALARVVAGSKASPPQLKPTEFGGPYPLPLGTGVEQPIVPLDPYDPYSPPAPPVARWPSMHP